MKKVILILVLCLLFISKSVSAESNYFTLIDDENTEYQINLNVLNGYTFPKDYLAYANKALKGYVPTGKVFIEKKILRGKFKWENPDYSIVEGEQVVNLNFISDNETIVFKLSVFGQPPLKSNTIIDKPDIVDDEINTGQTKETDISEEVSLTASTLLLSPSTTFDLNVSNKTEGATYSFISSDTKVAKVNAKNGVVNSVSDGEAIITCTETDAEGNKTKLTTSVIVRQDENSPILNETDISLEVGDIFDIDAENFTKGSKIKYTSSNKSIAKVTSSSGKVVGLNSGTCKITCTITKDKTVVVLKADVEVN